MKVIPLPPIPRTLGQPQTWSGGEAMLDNSVTGERNEAQSWMLLYMEDPFFSFLF